MYRFCGVGKLGIRRMGMSMQDVVFPLITVYWLYHCVRD